MAITYGKMCGNVAIVSVKIHTLPGSTDLCCTVPSANLAAEVHYIHVAGTTWH